MDLELDADLEALAESVRDMCTKHYDTDIVRQGEDGPGVLPPEVHQHLGRMGVLGMRIDPDFGGSGGGMVETAVISEEFGAALIPMSVLVSSVLVAELVNDLGTDDSRTQILPRLADGTQIASIGWAEPGRGYSPAAMTSTAEPEGDGIRLRGTKSFVHCAAQADPLLVVARHHRGEGYGVYAVPVAEGTLAEQNTMARELLHQVGFDLVVPASAEVTARPVSAAELEAVLATFQVALSAYCVGGIREVLRMTRDYAATREQFGKPIGSFQATAHRVSDQLVDYHSARLLAYQAAWAKDRDTPAALTLAWMAKRRGCDLYRAVTANGQQVFGGIGFITDVDVQLYYRRAKQVQMLWAEPHYADEQLARLILDDDGPGLLPAIIER
ncbi:acyl-CoA dehydrogenase family protein [Enemella sp. A6]|uniref:acyl-CoA dehydrogenase family protein n=1 Tax=Enemella sp. A6 TaxID=3440152 RepID=UPI003EB98FC9